MVDKQSLNGKYLKQPVTGCFNTSHLYSHWLLSSIRNNQSLVSGYYQVFEITSNWIFQILPISISRKREPTVRIPRPCIYHLRHRVRIVACKQILVWHCVKSPLSRSLKRACFQCSSKIVNW